MTNGHVDVLIVGAGLSGIGAAYYVQTRCYGRSYTILESRDAIGGTWDLFRYPGVRSDADMYTLGYAFRPWRNPKAIADGSSILAYIRETAQAYGIDQQIRFGHRVWRAAWCSTDARWSIEAECASGEVVRLTCTFLYMCSGYYDYDRDYTPAWPGVEQFAGPIVHPQYWPVDLDYGGKRVVIIGSGATAVTLVPAMAEQAAHITMLQRSPSYNCGPARPESHRRLAASFSARAPGARAGALEECVAEHVLLHPDAPAAGAGEAQPAEAGTCTAWPRL